MWGAFGELVITHPSRLTVRGEDSSCLPGSVDRSGLEETRLDEPSPLRQSFIIVLF